MSQHRHNWAFNHRLTHGKLQSAVVLGSKSAQIVEVYHRLVWHHSNAHDPSAVLTLLTCFNSATLRKDLVKWSSTYTVLRQSVNTLFVTCLKKKKTL